LHESEAFICKALKGKAIVAYAEPLIIRLRRTDESLRPIEPMAYAPVGERRERKFLIISALSACSAVRYFLEMP